MNEEQREHEKNLKKMEHEKRESGENRFSSDEDKSSSDNNRGHPIDAFSEENSSTKSGGPFNAGGNDSDYDGGHPTDSASNGEGRIDSSSTNSKEN